jgi:DNA-binding transcriptional MerR regulator
MGTDVGHTLRIGELSRRTGVSAELLRAWERRYGLLEPARTAGGLRLYSAEDHRRVVAMRRELDAGHSAAEAARIVLAGSGAAPAGAAAPPPGALDEARASLTAAFERFDAQAADAILDRLLAAFTVETVVSEVLLPYLAELGERWERGEASVAQEHFASNAIRARLLGLARGWDRGAGPVAVLACAPGEQHDLPLIMLGLSLRERGWRIVFLGAATPAASIAETADRIGPALVVVSATDPAALRREQRALAAIGTRHRLAVGGAGARPAQARRLNAEILDPHPVAAAAALRP